MTAKDAVGRVAPNDADAEKSVLGAILLESTALGRIVETLQAEDFYRENNAAIYRCATSLTRKGEPVDMVTLATELESVGLLGRIGGRAQLAVLQESVPTAANVEYYAKIVKDKSCRRRMIEVAGKVAALGYDEARELEGAVDEAHQLVFALTQQENGSYRSALELVLKVVAELENRVVGVPSGFYDLDELTNGFAAQDLVIVAGRPGMGKTAWVVNVAMHSALIGVPVLVFSIEMSAEMLMQRMLASRAQVDGLRMRKHALAPKDWERVIAQSGPIGDAPLFVDDSTGLNEMALMRRSRAARAMNNVGLIVVDYLGLVQGVRAENRLQEVSSVARTLKQVARELRVPVIAACQLNRQADTRGPDSKRPTLSDLRESGEIEQAADIVIGLYNEGYYDKSKPRHRAEAILLKQRNGPLGTVHLGWDEAATRFYNLTRTGGS